MRDDAAGERRAQAPGTAGDLRTALDPSVVATAIADAIERNRRHVVLPRSITLMAKFTEFPRRVSEITLTGINQDRD